MVSITQLDARVLWGCYSPACAVGKSLNLTRSASLTSHSLGFLDLTLTRLPPCPPHLGSNDRVLLERCLATSNIKVIHNTVARIVPRDAALFLRAAVDRCGARDGKVVSLQDAR